MSLKNPVTPPGIDPGTVRLVAQRLNHYASLDAIVSNITMAAVVITVAILSNCTNFPKIWKQFPNYELLRDDLKECHTEGPKTFGVSVQDLVP